MVMTQSETLFWQREIIYDRKKKLLKMRTNFMTERKSVVTKTENYSHKDEIAVMERKKCMNETENIYEWEKKVFDKNIKSFYVNIG